MSDNQIAGAGNVSELTETAGEYNESDTYVFDPSKSNLMQHAKFELEAAGLFDEDADYNGALAHAVMELIETFARQEHSGFSAMMTIDLFSRLARYEPLTPISSNPDEWVNVFEEDGKPHYQNKRRSTSFSRDGGQTWYDIEDSSLNNGDTWYTQEDTDTYRNDVGLDPDPDFVLDAKVKHKMWDELYELQREHREQNNIPHDGSVFFDADLNRRLRAEREQAKG